MSSYHKEVHVQVCGRQETLNLNKLDLQELSEAIEKRLELPPPFLFLDVEGRPLADNACLASCVSLGRQVVVKLTEGVVYDVSRRVDQLRHLQWGFIADQLSALKREQSRQSVEVRNCHAAISREQGLRESSYLELQQHLDDMRDSPSRDCNGPAPEIVPAAQTSCETDLFEFRQQLQDCWRLLKDADSLRAAGDRDSSIQSLEKALDTERQERTRYVEDLAAELQQQRLLGIEHRSQSVGKADFTKLAIDVQVLQQRIGETQAGVTAGLEHFKSATLDDIANSFKIIRADFTKDLSAIRAELNRDVRWLSDTGSPAQEFSQSSLVTDTNSPCQYHSARCSGVL
jgi:hypothetical protein